MPEYRRCRIRGDSSVHRVSLTTPTPFVEVVTSCSRRGQRYEETDEPIDCGECKVHVFLADVRAVQVRRRIAERQPGPMRLEIGPAAQDALTKSQAAFGVAGKVADMLGIEPTSVFGVPITVDDLMMPADGWRLLDADGEQIGQGEL